jgi:hypothetical protein
MLQLFLLCSLLLISGYRGDSTTKDKEVFIRWAQFGAFIPLMENGGGGEHRPWMYDEETVNIYRKYVLEHYRLIPYFMNAGMSSMESVGLKSSLKPLASKPTDTPYGTNPQPATYSYLIGDDILVHPVVHENGIVEMTFPAGNETWINWWDPLDKKMYVSGKDGDYSFVRAVDLDSYPVYVRKNAFIPLQKSSDDESIVFTWFCPESSSNMSTSVREPSSIGPSMKASVEISADGTLSAKISAHPGPVTLSLVGVSNVKTTAITPLDACAQSYDKEKKTFSLSCSDASLGLLITASGVSNSCSW